jgi:hypothetical protein
MAKNVRKNSNVIKLSSYKNRFGEILKLRKKILKNMGQTLFKIHDLQTFYYESLKQIAEVGRLIKNDEVSIGTCANIVNKKFGVGSKTAIIYKSPTRKPTQVIGETSLEIYANYILGIDKLPSLQLIELKTNVESHLKYIADLIDWYESDPFIQQVIKKDIRPSQHEERIKYDFYKKCIVEQQIILKHYLHGLEKRALAKSYYLPENLSPVFVMQNQYWDYPYDVGHWYYEEHYDYRKINLFRHRVYDIRISIIPDLKKLYQKDKEKFYRELFKLNPVSQIFSDINFLLPQLPLLHNRVPIFTELQKLFSGRRWISFYALALPQIEGLFSEMLEVIEPGKYSKSLTDKVSFVRLHHNFDGHFDYFQYIVPKLRNKFLHTGFDEDFKTKAFDSLTDLHYLVKVFEELENPLVKVAKIHARKDPMQFINYKDYGGYFQLLEQLNSEQKKKIAKGIEEFEKFLTDDMASIELMNGRIFEGLPEKIKDMTIQIEYYVNSSSIAYDLSLKSWNQVKKELPIEARTNLLRHLRILRENTEDIESMFVYLKYSPKYLPSINKVEQANVKRAFNQYKIFCQNIIAIQIESIQEKLEEE